MEGKRLRVLLVDHHALVRQCLALLLERDNPRLEVVTQAGSLAEGHACMNADGVDVAVVEPWKLHFRTLLTEGAIRRSRALRG